MTPFKLNLTIIKGITFGPVIFNFKQQDGSPFPLTNYNVLAYARRYHNAKAKINISPNVTDAANGQAQINLSDEQTLAFMGGEYGWDLILEDGSGIRTGPYFAGKLKIAEIYTHA